jgi:hypothetical protein
MRLKAKVGIATATCALAVAGPAVAQACNGKGGQQAQDKGQHAGQAGGKRGDHGQFVGFGRHGRSFRRSVFGVLVTWTATQTGTNTYSGTITVTKPNFKAHWARNGSSTQPTSTTQPTQVTYTFTNAKVFFGQGANPPAAGDLVKIIGARLNHCKSSTSTGSSTTTSTTSTTPTTSTGNVRAIFIAAPPSSSAPSSSSQS